MNKFSNRLEFLIQDRAINKLKLSQKIELSSSSPVSAWISGKKTPNLDSAIKLANYFNCSLDYLFGLKELDENKNFKQVSSFSIRLQEILKQKKLSQNKIIKETNFYSKSFNAWLHKNACPNMITVIELAKYLNVSLDYLAGRE